MLKHMLNTSVYKLCTHKYINALNRSWKLGMTFYDILLYKVCKQVIPL